MVGRTQLAAACVLVAACKSVPPPSLKGEVRGIPPSLTAYSRVLLVHPDSVVNALGLRCKTLADSMSVIRDKVQNIWAILEAEHEATIDRKCKAQSNDSLLCGLSDRITYSVISGGARDGIPRDAPDGYRRVALQMRGYAETRKRELQEHGARFAQQVSESLYQDLAHQDTAIRLLDANGMFEIAPADSALRALVMVKSPERFEFAMLPARGPAAQVIAYDDATFDLAHKCGD